MEKTFIEILEEFLEANYLTRKAFAEKIGVKPSQVTEWLRGKAKPGYESLKAMAKAYNVSADYFLGIIEDY